MISFERFTLPNGLRVLLHPNSETPLVAINVLCKAGSKYDPLHKSGLAHLFEHLMFSGTPSVPSFDEPIQKAGAENNAFTNNDHASYYSYGPAQNLETLLWVEADRLANLKLNLQTFQTQQKVVIEELYESCLNVPYGDVWHHLLPMIYTSHPYGWPTIGLSEEEIRSITLEDVEIFYKNFYHPENCILSVSGNFEVRRVLQLANAYFSSGTSTGSKLPSFTFEDEEYKAQHSEIKSGVPVTALFVAFPMPGRHHADYHALDLITDLLSSGRSSLFYNRFIKGSQIFDHADAYITGNIDTGLFIIEAKFSRGTKVERALDEIRLLLHSIQEKIIDENVLEKLINGIESSTVFSEISTISKAINLAYYESLGDANLINREVEAYRKISSEDIRNTASKYLNWERATTLLYR